MPAKRGGSSKGGAAAKAKTTPSGVTYDEFMKMSVEQREQVIVDILNNDSIEIPDYLDQTATQKVIYALGMDGKPQLMSDAELDKLSGQDLYRTVNGNKYLTAGEITDQIKLGNYTRLSDSGGSVYGRGIYFANNLSESLNYGFKGDAAVIRSKVLGSANIVTYSKLLEDMEEKPAQKFYTALYHGNYKNVKLKSADTESLFALTRGIDGWFDDGPGYQVILNRSKIAVSKTTKHYDRQKTSAWSVKSWDSLNDYVTGRA